MDSQHKRQAIIGFLALVWLITAFIGYIYIHKPFSVTELTGILWISWQILAVVIIISLAGGIGMLTKLRDLDVPPITRAVLTGALGLGIIGIVVLLVGVTVGINALMAVLLVAAIIVLRKQILLWWKYWLDAGSIYREAGKLGRIIFIFAATILLCQLMVALAPPLSFDALTYHLTIPKEFVQLGRIVYLPDNMAWGMAQQAETLYILAIFMGGTETATVLGWALGVMTLFAFVDFTGKVFNRDSAWVAVASLMCAPALAGLLSSGYVEWEAMLFGLAMLICLAHWVANMDHPALYMAGLFAGMALGTKYTAGIALVSGAMVILFFQKPYSLKKVAYSLALFGGAALAIALPWWIRNFLATSNPFYPLFVPSGAMDAIRLSLYQGKPPQDWSLLVLLPWQITVWGADGTYGFSASIGPLLLGLSPLALVNRQGYNQEQRYILKLGAIIILTTFLVWAIGSQFSSNLMETRYYFVNFTAWALLCAAGYFTISQIRLGNVRIKNLFAALILLALGFNVSGKLTTVLMSDPLLGALTAESRETYKENNLGTYQVAMQSIKALPENARVLMLWENRGLECVPKCNPDETIDQWFHDWTVYHNPAAIVQAWKEHGYDYVLLYRTGADFVREYHKPDPGPIYWDGLNTAMASLRLVKDVYGSYQLYAIP